jgi:hypothetical protein
MKTNILSSQYISLRLMIVRDKEATASETFKNSLHLAQHVEKWGYKDTG